jgi:glycosyltransferase involved in cell wall biosynthesis
MARDVTAPRRLALVTRRYPPLIGGAEKVLSYLAKALAEAGADVTVLTAAAQGAEALPREESVPLTRPRNGGRLQVVRLASSPLRFVGTWLYMRNLARWFAANPVDLAYVSMLKHDAYVTVSAGQRRGFPVVLRPEGAGETGDVAWQAKGNFGSRIARKCRQADAFVTISKEIGRELAHAGYDPARMFFLPNGVPVPEQSWQRRPDWRAAPVAVYVGRLSPEKGLDTLGRAWPLVRQAHPTARLVLVGQGPQQPELEAIAREGHLTIGPGQAIEFAGIASDVNAVLRAADLFVLPSNEEGMSIALLEAMVIGIPLVATAIPGNRRLISDFKQGRLCPPNDPPALAQTIIDQWNNFDRAFHMTRAARGRVEREFSIDAVARKHLELFENLLSKTS